MTNPMGQLRPCTHCGGRHYANSKTAKECGKRSAMTSPSRVRHDIFTQIAIEDEVSALMPQGDYATSYYEGTNRKHFGGTAGAGSQFTEHIDLHDLLEDVKETRVGGLSGDDRDKFIAMGCNPESFREGYRYLMVDADGVLGASDTTQYSDDTVIQAIKKHDRDEYRFSVELEHKPEVEFGTVVLLDDVKEDNLSEGFWNDVKDNPPSSVLLTAYPGKPGGFRGAVRDDDAKAWLDKRLESGEPLTIGEVKKNCWDGADFGLNVSVKN